MNSTKIDLKFTLYGLIDCHLSLIILLRVEWFDRLDPLK